MVIQVGKDVLPNGLWLQWRAWCENWAFAGAASEASLSFCDTSREILTSQKSDYSFQCFLYCFCDGRHPKRSKANSPPPVLQTRMKNMLPMHEFALDYFERLVKIYPNLDISLEVSTLFKTYYTSAARMVFFYFFRWSPAGSRIHPLCFCKNRISKKTTSSESL